MNVHGQRKECDMSVLIVHGDKKLLEILQDYFRDRGQEAEFAREGIECGEFLRDFVPQMEVLEVEFLWGGTNGVMALTRLNAGFVDQPVVLFDNDTPCKMFNPADAPALVAWLNEPFEMIDLVQRIQSNLPCAPNVRRAVSHVAVSTNFWQRCPVCGRSLRVPVHFLGETVACSHCHGRFVARDDADQDDAREDSVATFLAETDDSRHRGNSMTYTLHYSCVKD